jgi:hypothetical protein
MRNTTAIEVGEVAVLHYHNTSVVTYNRTTGELILDTGGFKTVTTKERMNHARSLLDLPIPYIVYQEQGQWFFSAYGANPIPFEGDSLTVNLLELE